ncbi:MAG: ferredoxin domain-containing protein [Anaerovoracaceae bacterium]|jgi:uncharacterized ferredoxin-like protein
MIKQMRDAESDAVLAVADMMVAAAHTAPKASGQDKVVTAVITGPEKDELARAMKKIANREDAAFIARDAENVENSTAVVAFGVRAQPFGLTHCSYCGFRDCRDMKQHGADCALNITDLGIAIGSAVSVAAHHHIDNRVMFSVGKGIHAMKIFPSDVTVCYGIPLSTKSKSIYFDRGPGSVLF